jgi:pilus assembly protein Flp/PilA
MSQVRQPDEVGASAVEYGLIVFAIAGLITMMVFMFGDAVVGSFTSSCNDIKAQAAPSASCS